MTKPHPNDGSDAKVMGFEVAPHNLRRTFAVLARKGVAGGDHAGTGLPIHLPICKPTMRTYNHS